MITHKRHYGRVNTLNHLSSQIKSDLEVKSTKSKTW